MTNIRSFFSEDGKSSPSVILSNLHSEPGCLECGLYKGCNSPRMGLTGNGKKGIFILAEAPGEQEDIRNEQLVGTAGEKLREYLFKFGIDLDEDCWKLNAINCRPPGNRKPTPKELRCCAPMYRKAIAECKPKLILLFGGAALGSYFMGKADADALRISSWHRLLIPDPISGAWVVPLFHPSYLLQNKDPNLAAIFELDLQFAISALQLSPPKFDTDYDEQIHAISDFGEIVKTLDSLRQAKLLFLDWETSGLKPYRPGHKIYSVGLAAEVGPVYSLPVQYPHLSIEQQQIVMEKLCALLVNNKIGKVAHNLKFEDKWARVILGIDVANWVACTMNDQHVIDCRPRLTKLEVQCLIRWGVEDYGKELTTFKKSDVQGFNTMYKVPLPKLLQYNGRDVYFTRKLYFEQEAFLKRRPKQQWCSNFFREGVTAFSYAEDEGIAIGEAYYSDASADLESKMKKASLELLSGTEATQFHAKYHKKLNLASPKDLEHLFYDVLKEPPKRFTAKTKSNSVDEEALTEMQNDFAVRLVQLRKYKKMQDYIFQYMRETYAGHMHPFFDLHLVETGRSCSSNPNFQNVPKHDKEANSIVRKGIIPSPGNRLMEIDYKAAEVRIMACYTLDPALIDYVKDKTKDMHRDQALVIFMLRNSGVTAGELDDLRNIAKNKFVFAQFYGDWYKSCAKYIWEVMISVPLTVAGIPILEHLRRCGITDYRVFEEHMRKVERSFWSMFKVSKTWRDGMVNFYRANGFVESYFGFRRVGYLSRNQVINTPIQGTAFHCLLWSFIQLSKQMKRAKLKSKLTAQIHDSAFIDLVPQELDIVAVLAQQVMCVDLGKAFDWLVVPMEIDIALSEVDGSWSEMQKYKLAA